MAKTVIQITHSETGDFVNGVAGLNVLQDKDALRGVINYLEGVLVGAYKPADVEVEVGAVQATATITSTGASTDGDVIDICGVEFTAVESVEEVTAESGTYLLNATPATQAANIVSALAGSDLPEFEAFTASSVAGVVTLTANVGGLGGNALSCVDADTENLTTTEFTGGAVEHSHDLEV